MSNKKRVVITGMGIVSSIGNNVKEVKNSLINQKSGIVHSPTYQEMGFRSQIHGEVKLNLEDYHSHNTKQLDVEEMSDLLINLEFIKQELI